MKKFHIMKKNIWKKFHIENKYEETLSFKLELYKGVKNKQTNKN